MSQIRIGFERVKAGSAARAAEADALGQAATPRLTRVQAGSAARMAEEAKRAGRDGLPGGGASFSLRAQGGRIQRMEAPVGHPPQPAAAADRLTPPQAPLPNAADDQVAGKTDAHPADSPQYAGNRLTSFLRGLFLPETPSQP